MITNKLLMLPNGDYKTAANGRIRIVLCPNCNPCLIESESAPATSLPSCPLLVTPATATSPLLSPQHHFHSSFSFLIPFPVTASAPSRLFSKRHPPRKNKDHPSSLHLSASVGQTPPSPDIAIASALVADNDEADVAGRRHPVVPLPNSPTHHPIIFHNRRTHLSSAPL